MNLRQFALNRYVLEKVKDGKPLEITNDEKVDLGYVVNYWNNILTETEKEIAKKPDIKGITFKLTILRS